MVCQSGRYRHLQHSRDSKAVCKVARRSTSHRPPKVMSKAELDNMNSQISIRRRTRYQLSATCNNERNEIAYLQNKIQVLEGYVNGLKNRNQQQEEIQNKFYI
ncbi:MAG: hypothetical protein WBY71_00840 [Nitrososphaeraceae archaeon]